MSWRRTEPVSTVRSVAPDSRDIAGIAVPYGQVTQDVEGGPEAFAPAAFRASVEHWSGRQDGARMAFRPAHGEKPVGTVSELRDTPAGVEFRASIMDSPAGDEYLANVRAGLNGVSIEFAPGQTSRKMRDGTVLHRDARLHAIAGSVSPAYDGARIALRDMEEPVNTETNPPAEPEPTPAPAPEPAPQQDRSANVVELTPQVRSALERSGVQGYTGAAIVTRPELIYKRDSEFGYPKDIYLQMRGDAAAADRVQKHQGFLQEYAEKLEREAASRIFYNANYERASDVLSSEIPGAYPTDFIPGLLTPRILKGRPMGSFYQRFPISNARPKTFAKVTTSTAVVVQSAEGAALGGTDLATTAVTVTPLIYGAFTDVSRQVIDGADPSALSMIFSDLMEAYAQATETVIKTAVEAGSTASGVAVVAATPYAGVLANVVNYYAVRFRAAEGVFIPPAEYAVLLAQGDTTGRPFIPMIGAMNSDATVAPGGTQTSILGAQGYLSYASTVNVNVIGVPSDFVIYESSIAQFTYDQVVGPQAVRVGLWAYLVVGTRLGSLKVTAA